MFKCSRIRVTGSPARELIECLHRVLGRRVDADSLDRPEFSQ